jgi:hypothetical protein
MVRRELAALFGLAKAAASGGEDDCARLDYMVTASGSPA